MQNLYVEVVPVMVKMLGGLKLVLQKSAAHAKEKGMSEEAFLGDRIAPDMFPFARQVQIATDNAKGAAARLTGTENPKYEDTEKTFAELQARIDKTLAFLATFGEAAFADAAERQVTLPYFPGKYMTGLDYAREYAIPNFFFHTCMAYALARKNGVDIGKTDYMGGSLPLKDVA